MRESSLEDDPRLREAVEDLKNKSDLVWKMGQEKQRTLEQAHPLAKHFWETNKDMSNWLEEAAVIVADLKVMSIDAEQVKKQQEQIKVCWLMETDKMKGQMFRIEWVFLYLKYSKTRL